MKQSNCFLFALGLLTLGACTGPKIPKSLATSWQEKHLVESDSLLREVASRKDAGMCLEKIFTTLTLKNEIKDYENKITGLPVQGEWRNLDLATLPIPQANYLKNYGHLIGDLANPDRINYSGCSNLPCIINRVYEKDENYIAGYVHYLWYLKFGNYLSLDNKVPDQQSAIPGVYNGKQFRVSDYLYNETELYGLWRITHLLQKPYTSLSNLKEIQRIPRKENLEGYSGGVCGLASSTGHIRLQDGCLNVADYDQNRGLLYIGVIHEMSHMLDYLEAKKRKSGGYYRSHEPDYLDIVGFYKYEYTNKEGKLVSAWKLKENAKVIRGYSATSPVENFADSLAYFRQDGEKTKSKIDSKQFDWISANYFNGEAYDKAGSRARLLKKYGALLSGSILTKIIDCSSMKQDYQSNYFTPNDFSGSTLAPWMMRCISYEAEQLSAQVTAQVKTYEVDGCPSLYFREDELAWNSSVKLSLKKQFGIYIQEITNDPEYLDKIKNFNSTLASRLMANEAILQCYSGSTLTNMSECYDKRVVEISRAAALELKLPQPQADEMAALYLTSHPYSSVTEDLYSTYRSILNANESLITEEADSVWQMCLNKKHDDNEKPRGSFFSPRKGYLVSSFYNCLNTQLPITLKEIVRAFEFDGQKITHPVEELILLEFLQPRVTDELQKLHEISMAVEAKELEKHFSQVSDSIRQNLLSDFSWVSSLTDTDLIYQGCRAEAFTQITYLPLYHLKRDAFTEMISLGPCRDIMSEPVFKIFLDNSKQKVDREVFSKVETILEKFAEKRALYCREIIPWKWERTRATVRIPRKTCMTLGWSEIETDAIRELISDPLAKRFKMSESEFRFKISDVQDSVRTKVEEKHF